jgi:hypothetical protein
VTLFGIRHSLNPGNWNFQEQMFAVMALGSLAGYKVQKVWGLNKMITETKEGRGIQGRSSLKYKQPSLAPFTSSADT